MNVKQKNNLKRLLAPRHIAFIGGADADYAARQCAKKFKGKVWGVNPKRSEMGGQPCFVSVSELPEPPDAVFLATPRSATLPILADLEQAGTGGVVCFTAGYGETGEQGKQLEQELVSTAGDLALVGPNCYGLINYVTQATMWPFGAGDQDCKKGIALVMQSGMITADMAMNQRSVPISYVISAGNQAVLAVEDYVDALVDNQAVSGFGIYIEGIKDVQKFADAAIKALQSEKPIVLLKAGSSSIGSRLAVSHTGSLSGADEAHQAFFDRLGIVRVHSPELLLETLKFMTISGIPKGRKVAAFTCSGGEALMVADYCERKNLALPQPSKQSFDELTNLLPDIATVSNPLDYTTPLWGNSEVMPRVFEAALRDGFDASIFIQDYPPEGFDADPSYYRTDALSYISAVSNAGIPAGICSELSENFDRKTRELLIQGNVTPLQGFDRGLDAISLACDYYKNRNRILSFQDESNIRLIKTTEIGSVENPTVNEWEAKQQLSNAGVAIPKSVLVPLQGYDDVEKITSDLRYPLVAKLVADDLAHKTEMGAVSLNIENPDELKKEFLRLLALADSSPTSGAVQGVLVEEMVAGTIHELLIGIQRDAQFGLVMVIASGGILVELFKDSRTLLLPVSASDVSHALSQLTCYPLLCGYRGRDKCNITKLIDTILGIALFAQSNADTLIEMDVNPLLVLKNEVVAVDALLKYSHP